MKIRHNQHAVNCSTRLPRHAVVCEMLIGFGVADPFKPQSGTETQEQPNCKFVCVLRGTGLQFLCFALGLRLSTANAPGLARTPAVCRRPACSSRLAAVSRARALLASFLALSSSSFCASSCCFFLASSACRWSSSAWRCCSFSSSSLLASASCLFFSTMASFRTRLASCSTHRTSFHQEHARHMQQQHLFAQQHLGIPAT